MRLEPVEDWYHRESHKTQRGNYVGIAIGPDSDDGVVIVNGTTLQAGRVLALPSDGDGYTIRRATGIRCRLDGNDVSDISELRALTKLDLMLFEHPEELATEVARPSGEYASEPGAPLSLTSPGTGEGDTSGEDRVLTLPFVGRRQAQIRLHRTSSADGNGTYTYRVLGRKFSRSLRAVQEVELVNVSGLDTDDETFNIGGDNEAEDYHELAVVVSVEDGPDAAACTMTFHCDATTIGEIGVR